MDGARTFSRNARLAPRKDRSRQTGPSPRTRSESHRRDPSPRLATAVSRARASQPPLAPPLAVVIDEADAILPPPANGAARATNKLAGDGEDAPAGSLEPTVDDITHIGSADGWRAIYRAAARGPRGVVGRE